MAEMFTKKMSLKNEELDARMRRHKEKLMDYSHRLQTDKEEKRRKEIERINETKRVIISSRLADARLVSAKRLEENKRAQANFEFVKRNLPPTIEEVGQKKLMALEEKHSEEALQMRKSWNKSIDLEELVHHGKRVDCIIKKREIEGLIKRSESIPSISYDPLKLKKHQNNPFFTKKKQLIDNQAKSIIYADAVQGKIEQRSPESAIKKWHEGQVDNNFGYYYRKEVQKRKEQKLINWDPNSYMDESKAIGRRMKAINSLNMSESEKQLPVQVLPKVHMSYQDFIQKEVDIKKVNNQDLTNKKLNKYERLERAKKYLTESKPSVKNNPAILETDIMAEKAIRSRNPNIFKKYLNTLDYLEKQAAEQEKLENFEKKLDKKFIPPNATDSIDLLSGCIKSKLKILAGT